MKKLFAIAGLVLFAACQEDDAVEPVYNIPEDVYVTQMTETLGGTNITHTYTYDGNRLLTDTDSQGYVREYSYVNGLLVQEDVYLNSELAEYTIFSYTFNKKLAQAIHITSNGDGTWSGLKTTYDRNTDGTISLEQYQGDEIGQYDFIKEGTLTLTNGNVTAVSLTNEDEDEEDEIIPFPVVTTITYNGSKAPFKNVFSYEGLYLAQLQGGPNTIASVTTVITTQGENGPEETGTTITYTYQEGANGYPAQESHSNGVARQYIYN
ncbi:hypothetical protein AM493_18565 [Flavobacterium akiainvivens]|uniref:DUF4595 domain-containing protein n=1 Tax=Flavobacterium akiainvivens TaxID=1202724 RepID=A0A0M8MFI4_9FLAO|nr:hypothetical protein [Flavobacterium akiainvivens]KOS07834.1 hypothetical protein AM493_18565 [Flavobacterium akiainvivens]SFQ27238.1 hypothetical protein SAMN05444144_102294 [Flavobacterium akiainvivens]